LIYRLHREKIHFHVHEHDGQRHLHAHSHAHHHAVGKMSPDQSSHAAIRHHHKHPKKPFGALCVGMMHGAAGTGSLMVLAVTATQSFLLSLAYLAIFCAGSLLGDDAVDRGGISAIHAHLASGRHGLISLCRW
jgi:hypothetical protein